MQQGVPSNLTLQSVPSYHTIGASVFGLADGVDLALQDRHEEVAVAAGGPQKARVNPLEHVSDEVQLF